MIVPPFAEELNRSRKMLAVLCRRLQNLGYSCLLPDLFGTGDSYGEFADASWDIWQEDLMVSLDWFKRGHDVKAILSLRAGALIIDQAWCNEVIDKVILWQPMISGEILFKQFLRIQVMADKALGKESKVQSYWDNLCAGELVECAGYLISPDLFKTFAMRKLEAAQFKSFTHIHWLENALDRSIPNPANAKLIEQFNNNLPNFAFNGVKGSPFWQTTEIEMHAELLAMTETILH